MKTLPRYMQQGGSISQEEATDQVVQVISSIAGVSTDQVISKLQEISQDEKAVELLSQALELVNKGDEQGIQWIKQTFGSKFAKGGKIHAFICKHAKGGNCGCNKVEKGLNGMSMSDALNGAMDAYGYDMSQARNAYINAKNALRSSGLRGRELRQQARQMISTGPATETEAVRTPMENPLGAIDTSRVSNSQLVAQNNGTLAGGSTSSQLANNYRQIQDYSGRDFNSAFAAARNAYLNDNGANIFNWKGRTYNTDLASGSTTNSTPVRSREEVAQPNQDIAMVQPGGGNTSWMWSAFDRVFGKKENGGIIESDQQGGSFKNISNLKSSLPTSDIYNTGGYVNLGNGMYGRRYNSTIELPKSSLQTLSPEEAQARLNKLGMSYGDKFVYPNLKPIVTEEYSRPWYNRIMDFIDHPVYDIVNGVKGLYYKAKDKKQ